MNKQSLLAAVALRLFPSNPGIGRAVNPVIGSVVALDIEILGSYRETLRDGRAFKGRVAAEDL